MKQPWYALFPSTDGKATPATFRSQLATKTAADFHEHRIGAICRITVVCFSLVTGLVFAPHAGAQTPGMWNPAGSMAVGRGTPTAILLQNGTVLVVGGASSATSDLYDPVANAWSTVGSMSTGRNYQAGTILSDGRVLIAGGIDPNNVVLATAEIYDPSTQTWTPTGNLNTPRYMHSATLLPNGMVLVAGGWPGPGLYYGSGTYALTSSELWDPATGTWTATGDLPSPYADHAAILLNSGKVLIAGGESYGQGGLGRAVIATAATYDPFSGTWTSVPDMSASRDHAPAVLMSDGTVLVAGGSPGACCGGQSTAERFDPNALAWTSTPDMSTGRDGPGASAIFNGEAVLISGGYSCCSDPNPTRASSEYFDLATAAWHLTGSFIQARAYHTSITLLDGTVLAVGGGFSSAERYYPDTKTYQTAAVQITSNVSTASPLR